MSQEIQEIIIAPSQQPPQVQQKTVNEDMLDEVRNLKKIISELAEREAAKMKETSLVSKSQAELQQINPQSEFLQSKLAKTLAGEGRAKGSGDIYRNFKNEWKVRMANKPKPVLHSLREDNTGLFPKNDEKPTNLEESIIKHLSFANSRSDTDEEQPVRTQFFTPETRQAPTQSGELRFRKTDIIPMIENDRNRFRSYITAQKANISHIKADRVNPARQSYSKSVKQVSLAEKVATVELNRESDKTSLISAGKQLLSLLYNRFTEDTAFSIKKYKNCLVFSLMPITKAIIYHYDGDVYFGGISQDEEGRVTKNGAGVQIVKGRHFYQGQFTQGKKNGRGKILYENGDKYDGQWLEGQIYGYGRFQDGKKGGTFEGLWKKGEFYGEKKKESSQLQFQ